MAMPSEESIQTFILRFAHLRLYLIKAYWQYYANPIRRRDLMAFGITSSVIRWFTYHTMPGAVLSRSSFAGCDAFICLRRTAVVALDCRRHSNTCQWQHLLLHRNVTTYTILFAGLSLHLPYILLKKCRFSTFIISTFILKHWQIDCWCSLEIATVWHQTLATNVAVCIRISIRVAFEYPMDCQ